MIYFWKWYIEKIGHFNNDPLWFEFYIFSQSIACDLKKQVYKDKGMCWNTVQIIADQMRIPNHCNYA